MGLLSTIGTIAGTIFGGPLGGAIGGVIGGGVEAGRAGKAEERAASDILQAQRESRALNIERYGEAKGYLEPYIGEARTAREQLMVEMGLAPGEAGTAYMETPGYQSLLEERQRGAESAAAGGGYLYSGRRIQEAADVGGTTQSQFYTNYMNLLQSMGSPGVATNLASLGVGQAATMGQQQMLAQQAASRQQVAGAGAEQAAWADVGGAAANISGYLSSLPPTLTPARTPGYMSEEGYI